MSLNINQLLGSIANATYTPSLNPDAYGVDAKGRVVNKAGAPVALYNNPNWFQRGFSPEAQGVVDINRQTMGNPLGSTQQQTLEQQGIIGKAGAEETGRQNTVNDYNSFTKDNPLGAVGMQAFGYTPDRAGAVQTQANIDANAPQAIASNLVRQQNKEASAAPPEANPDITKYSDWAAHNLLPAQGANELFQALNPGWNMGGYRKYLLDPGAGLVNIEGNPMSMMSGGLGGGGTIQDGKGNMFTTPTPVGHQAGFNTPADGGTNSVPPPITAPVQQQLSTPVNPHGISNTSTHSLLGQAGGAGADIIASHIAPLLNYARDAKLGYTYGAGDTASNLLGSQAALPPSQQEVGAGRARLAGMPQGYTIDDDGNVFYHGQFIPEEKLKGTSAEKWMKIHMAAKKHMQDQTAEANLPHRQ